MKILLNAVFPVIIAGVLDTVFYLLIDYFFGNAATLPISGTIGSGVAAYFVYQNYFKEKPL